MTIERTRQRFESNVSGAAAPELSRLGYSVWVRFVRWCCGLALLSSVSACSGGGGNHAPQQPAYGPAPVGPPAAAPPGGPTFARYGRMDRATCEAELARRAIPAIRGEETPGVLAPIRLRGPLSGVSIHSGLPAKQRDRSHLEIFDCRLVLALDDFAALIASRGVVEMIHMSSYRPQSENGCTPRHIGEQHCAALAVDVGYFKRSDGVVLNVEKDFHGRIGQETCGGVAAPNPPSPAANELWNFLCEATRRTLFAVILTPNYNAEHRNHFHLEITPGSDWMMIK